MSARVGILSLALASAAVAAEAPGAGPGRAAYEAGHYDEAIAAWEAELPKLGVSARVALEARIANAHRRAGRLAQARTALTDLLKRDAVRADPGIEGLIRHYRARAAIQAGEPAAALSDLVQAADCLRRAGDRVEAAAVALSLAGLQYLQGDLGAAYDAYAEALDAAMQAKDVVSEGTAIEGLAACLEAVGEEVAAEGLLAEAERLFRGLGAVARAETVHLRRALNDLTRGVNETARRWLAEHPARPDMTPDERLEAALLRSTLAFDAGRRKEAVDAVEAVARTLGPADGRVATRAALSSAEARLALGDRDAASAWLEDSAAWPSTAFEDRFRDLIRGALLLGAGDPQGAVEPLGRVVAREARFFEEFQPEFLRDAGAAHMLDASGVLYATALARTAEPVVALAAARRAKARGTWALLSTGRRPTPSGDLLATVRGDRDRIGMARRRLGVLKAWAGQEVALDPRRFRLIANGRAVALEYLVSALGIEVFYVTGTTIEHRTVPVSPEALQAEIAALDAAIRDRSPDWRAPAERLSGWLLGPFGPGLAEAGRAGAHLAIVPHGALHRVPFATLPLGDGLLADTLSEFYLPNLGLLAGLGAQEGRLRDTPRVHAFGRVRRSQFGDLPGAAAEMAFLARQFRAVTHEGAAATLADLERVGRESDILHLALHGVRGEADAAAYLELDAPGDTPRRLTAGELAATEVPAGLVFLAACDSAGGTTNPNDESPDALDRAFLLAGARAVVAARWPLADASARRFVETFYSELPARGRLDALAAGRRAIRFGQADGADPSRGLLPVTGGRTPPDHPYFWAGYTLSGEPL